MRLLGFPLDLTRDQWQEPDLKGGGSPQYPLALTNWGAWTPSGGVAFSATADHARGKVPAAPTGGLAFGGAAATQFYTIRAWTPAGGLTFGGAAATSYVSGGAGGTSYVAPTPTGGVGFSGAATTSYVAVVLVPTGTVLFDDFGARSYFDLLDHAPGTGAAPAEERNAGGYGAQNISDLERQRERARTLRLKRWTKEDEEELAALLAAIPDEPAPQESSELARLKALVNEYAATADAELLSRRAQRALDFAQRAQTQLAYALAAREIERQQNDEELAILLALASED